MSYFPENTTDYKLSEESAKEQLGVLFAFYETDFSDLPDNRRDAVEEVLSKVAKGIRAGKLEIKECEDGPHIIQRLRNGQTLDYRPLDGKIKPKLDAAGDSFYKKVYVVLGGLCGFGEDVIVKLSPPDLKLAENLAGFLLVV